MRVALDTDRFSLIHGDSLTVLKSLADKSIDIVVTDPPYSPHVHQKFGKERRNDGAVVPAALDFPPMTIELMHEVAQQFVRVTKGWILIFSDEFVSAKWGECIAAAGGTWVRTGMWIKTNPKPQMTGDRPASGAEQIVICHAKEKGFEWNGRGHAAVWRGNRDASYGDDPHPNQKPAWLLQALIGMFCPPGGLVLDSYLGSGTTAVGALVTERLPGETTLNTSCKACSKRLLDAYQPPLPQGARVLGVEGAQKYVDLVISRIKDFAPNVVATEVIP